MQPSLPGLMLLFAAGALVITDLSPAQQQSYRRRIDTPIEIAQLPKYCYDQYVDQSLWKNPEYSITAACGVGMNHFCPGLINLSRAQKASIPKGNRRDQLRDGKTNVQYTLDRMSPNCRYRDDVNTAMMRAKVLEKILR